MLNRIQSKHFLERTVTVVSADFFAPTILPQYGTNVNIWFRTTPLNTIGITRRHYKTHQTIILPKKPSGVVINTSVRLELAGRCSCEVRFTQVVPDLISAWSLTSRTRSCSRLWRPRSIRLLKRRHSSSKYCLWRLSKLASSSAWKCWMFSFCLESHSCFSFFGVLWFSFSSW